MNQVAVGKAPGPKLFTPVPVLTRPRSHRGGSAHYEATLLADKLPDATVLVDDFPVTKTLEGAWKEFPPPVLACCDGPLAEGAPSPRGVWRVNRGPQRAQQLERTSQKRVVITAGGVIHDVRAATRQARSKPPRRWAGCAPHDRQGRRITLVLFRRIAQSGIIDE